MVQKNILLKQFLGYSDFEEALIARILDFTDAMGTDGLPPDSRQLFRDTLEKLRSDSQRHNQMMKEIAQYIKHSPKDEL